MPDLQPDDQTLAASNDDVYVNDGETYQDTAYYPTEPQEQKESQAHDAGIKAASYPIMPELAEWFQTAITDCDNIHNIQVTAMTVNGVQYSRQISVEAQVLAYQLLKEKLQEKAEEFAKFGETNA